jgi:hypothetical protein
VQRVHALRDGGQVVTRVARVLAQFVGDHRVATVGEQIESTITSRCLHRSLSMDIGFCPFDRYR